MALLKRIANSLRRHGLMVSLFKLYVALVDHWFDLRYGTDTCGWALLEDLSIKSENRSRGVRYEPARVVLLRRMFRVLAPLTGGKGTVVDMGAGKGRVLLVASQFGYGSARGVEFAHELCAIARRNCARFAESTGAATKFEVIESDVVEYTVAADDAVFVFFNPFDSVVLGRVLDNIAASLAAAPRSIHIGYYSPQHDETIAQHPAFAKVRDEVYRGYRFAVYTNRVG